MIPNWHFYLFFFWRGKYVSKLTFWQSFFSEVKMSRNWHFNRFFFLQVKMSLNCHFHRYFFKGWKCLVKKSLRMSIERHFQPLKKYRQKWQFGESFTWRKKSVKMWMWRHIYPVKKKKRDKNVNLETF